VLRLPRRSGKAPDGDVTGVRPIPLMTLRPPGCPTIAIGFGLPAVPGIPDPHSQLSAGIGLAAESVALAMLPSAESEATIGALSETYIRARYHKLRFDECMGAAMERRRAIGGPVVADWHAVPPIVWEASAFLGSARTVVDLIVYVAARRAGKSEATADRWDASEAIAPKCEPGGTPPTRFDVPEVLALRGRRRWFELLNLYRNVVYHRGLGSNRWGYHSRGDSAEEASDPSFNAMLLPDESSLRDRKRPHEWTYSDGRRLDELVNELDAGLSELLIEILTTVWGCEIPKPGTIPKSEQPTAMLHVALPAVIEYLDCSVVPVFESRAAARRFEDLKPHAELILRAVKPTTMQDGEDCFLLGVSLDASRLPHDVRLYGMVDGVVAEKASFRVDPATDCPIEGIVPLRILNAGIGTLYVRQSPRQGTTRVASAAPGQSSVSDAELIGPHLLEKERRG
jgi:hypothetical protein